MNENEETIMEAINIVSRTAEKLKVTAENVVEQKTKMVKKKEENEISVSKSEYLQSKAQLLQRLHYESKVIKARIILQRSENKLETM